LPGYCGLTGGISILNVLNHLRHPDRMFALVLIGLAAVMFVITGNLEQQVTPGAMSASTYPKLILVCIMLLSGLILIKPAAGESDRRPVVLRGLPVILLTATYIALIELAGFFVITPLFLFVLPLFAGYRRYMMIAISVVVITASLYGVFVEILSIPLPQGLLGD